MTHLIYIVPAYLIAAVLVAWFALDARLRTRRARHRLAAIDPRAQRAGGAGSSDR